MTGVTLAPAGPAHARILAALHAACFAASWDAKAMAELLPLPGLRATIALAGDEPVGLVLVRVAADEAEVLTICTLPAWRRRGIAGRLMEAAGDQATRAGAVRLYLEVGGRRPGRPRPVHGAGLRRGGAPPRLLRPRSRRPGHGPFALGFAKA